MTAQAVSSLPAARSLPARFWLARNRGLLIAIAAFLVLFGCRTWISLGSLGVNSALGRALAADDDDAV